MLIKTPYFFHSDIDLIYPPTFVKEITKHVTFKGKPVRIIFNNHNLAKCFYSESFDAYIYFYNENKENKDKSRKSSGIAPGNGLIHLESFKAIRGYNERYIGYGPEDADFNYRINFLCDEIVLDDKNVNTYHLYHVISIPKDLFRKNIDICEKYKKHTKDIKKFDRKKHLQFLRINNEDWGLI
jgi:hypothetical protein